MANFHALAITELERDTDDAIRVSFSVPENLADTFRFQHGQYLTLRAHIAGEEIRRSYSICSAVGDENLCIAIRAVPDGKFSNYANHGLAVGDTIDVMPPAGNFTAALNPKVSRHYLCIAAGSGITPIMSIIKTVLAREPRSHVTLLYGNRSVASIMFREDLADLKNQHMARFQLIHILSREQRDVEILNGRITNRKGAELCEHLLDLKRVDEFFLCGPEGMVSEVARGLRRNDIEEEKIHLELFGASAADAETTVAKHQQRARRLGGRLSHVAIKADGRSVEIELAPDGENILDAALAAGLDLPFACKGGVCATCKCKLLEGEIEMDLSHALSTEEIASGAILSCQAHPISATVRIDFDQAL